MVLELAFLIRNPSHLQTGLFSTRQDGVGISWALRELGMSWTECELQTIFSVLQCFGEWGKLGSAKESIHC